MTTHALRAEYACGDDTAGCVPELPLQSGEGLLSLAKGFAAMHFFCPAQIVQLPINRYI